MVLAEDRLVNEQYGRGLAALRDLAGIRSQVALGKRLDMKQTTISEIESGKRPLKAHEIERVLSFFTENIPGFDEADCLKILRGPALRALVTGNDDIGYFLQTAA